MMAQFGSMMVMLPAMYFMNKIDFTDPENVFRLRVAYGIVDIALFVLCGVLYWLIKRANNRQVIQVPAVGSFGQADPSQPAKRQTVMEYDMAALRKYLQSHATSTAITCFIHWKFGIVPPLFLQCVMNPFQASQQPLVKLYLFGDTSPELATRPWAEPKSPLSALFGGGGDTPAAAPASPAVNDTGAASEPKVRELTEEEAAAEEAKVKPVKPTSENTPLVAEDSGATTEVKVEQRKSNKPRKAD
jgi:hypothetical protein